MLGALRRLAPAALALLMAAPPLHPARAASPDSLGPGVAGPVVPPPPGPDARWLLTWRAPYGDARAREDLAEKCAPGAEDTLWLCFDPVRDGARLLGMTATLHVWPAAGDTLDPHWRFDLRPHYGGLRAEFNPDSTGGAAPPWPPGGTGGLRARSTRDGLTIRMVYAVAPQFAPVLGGGKLYAFARLIVPRPPAGPACGRAVCFEWETGSLAFGVRSEPTFRRGVRYASWHSPGAEVCARFRKFSGPDPWRPGARPH